MQATILLRFYGYRFHVIFKRCSVVADIYSSGFMFLNCLQFSPNFHYRDCIIRCIDLGWTTYNHLSYVFWAVMYDNILLLWKRKLICWKYLSVDIKLKIHLVFSFILLSCIILTTFSSPSTSPIPPLSPLSPRSISPLFPFKNRDVVPGIPNRRKRCQR